MNEKKHRRELLGVVQEDREMWECPVCGKIDHGTHAVNISIHEHTEEFSQIEVCEGCWEDFHIDMTEEIENDKGEIEPDDEIFDVAWDYFQAILAEQSGEAQKQVETWACQHYLAQIETGGGCTALARMIKHHEPIGPGTCEIEMLITRADDPSAPKNMKEAITISISHNGSVLHTLRVTGGLEAIQ